VLKVILETGHLSSTYVCLATRLACKAGVDFVKTSTGFGPRGASLEDIHAMSEVIRVESKLTKHRTGIKASGGIKTWDQARSFLEAGADRLGTSSAFEITQQFLSRDS
jgi:deoxyribose-phosphate aldolase